MSGLINKIQESISKANSFTSAEGSGENAHQTERQLRFLSLSQHCALFLLEGVSTVFIDNLKMR
jgi:hypothetical protein